MERWYIEHTLNRVNGKVDLAALRLKVPRSSLYQKLKRYGIGFRRSCRFRLRRGLIAFVHSLEQICLCFDRHLYGRVGKMEQFTCATLLE